MFLAAFLMTTLAPVSAADLEDWLKALTPATVVEGRQVETVTVERAMRAKNVPGAQVVLIDDGKVVASLALGEAEKGRPVTTDTRFQAASISKPVAAMTIMALVEDGHLDLDAPVNDQLKSWRIPSHQFTDAVTLRHLLSHTAGTTVSGFPGYSAGAEVPTIVQILEGVPPANTAPVTVSKRPGEGFRYSGGGFTIAELVAEDATGKPFETIAQEEVLTPLGMVHSSFAHPKEFAEVGIAKAHYGDGSPIAGGFHHYPEQAAASLWTTAEDLARFSIALARSAEGEGGYPITPASARLMLTAVTDDYGLGIGLGKKGEAARFGHSGSNQGFKSTMQFFLSTGEGIIVLTNGDRGAGLIRSIVATVAAKMGWSGMGPEQLTPELLTSGELMKIAGRYKVGDAIHTISVDGGELNLIDPDGVSEPAIPVEEGRLYLPKGEQILQVVRAEDGTVSGLEFRGNLFPRIGDD